MGPTERLLAATRDTVVSAGPNIENNRSVDLWAARSVVHRFHAGIVFTIAQKQCHHTLEAKP
ncbi:MAG: hypothetical protein ACOYEP_08585 [Limnochordia bacterium]